MTALVDFQKECPTAMGPINLKKCKMKKRIIPVILLIAYIIVLIEVLVFKHLALIRIGQMRFNFGGTQEGPANLIPFKTILYYLQGHNGLLIGGINIIGNIIALVPLGFLFPFIFSKVNWKNTILLALASGLIIEVSQVLLHVGIFDIDDVILNGLGVVIGFWKFNIYSNFSKNAKAIISNIVFSLLGLLITLFTLSYYKLIHLPISIEPSIEKEHLQPLNEHQAGQQKCCDLCGGTGGTGVIVSKNENSITIKGRKGTNEVIQLTKQTTIKNSAGIATKAELKIGDHVTVIIDETETASLILVCEMN